MKHLYRLIQFVMPILLTITVLPTIAHEHNSFYVKDAETAIECSVATEFKDKPRNKLLSESMRQFVEILEKCENDYACIMASAQQSQVLHGQVDYHILSVFISLMNKNEKSFFMDQQTSIHALNTDISQPLVAGFTVMDVMTILAQHKSSVGDRLGLSYAADNVISLLLESSPPSAVEAEMLKFFSLQKILNIKGSRAVVYKYFKVYLANDYDVYPATLEYQLKNYYAKAFRYKMTHAYPSLSLTHNYIEIITRYSRKYPDKSSCLTQYLPMLYSFLAHF